SRVDTKIDGAIDAAVQVLPAGDPRRGELESLRGRAAIANARLAYEQYEQVFGSPRFAALRAKGARVQRPLWASTSTKNPAYPDTYYVEALIGADTVDTMPPATIVAYKDHGKPALRLEDGMDEAAAVLQRIEDAGISM